MVDSTRDKKTGWRSIDFANLVPINTKNCTTDQGLVCCSGRTIDFATPGKVRRSPLASGIVLYANIRISTALFQESVQCSGNSVVLVTFIAIRPPDHASTQFKIKGSP